MTTELPGIADTAVAAGRSARALFGVSVVGAAVRREETWLGASLAHEDRS